MQTSDFIQEWQSESPYIKVHTSGSTGAPKEMLVEKSRMVASAQMTIRFLKLHEGDTALLCMPLEYIAGKMMVVRSIVGKLDLITVTPSSHPLAGPLPHIHFAAMVPMQVKKTLDVPIEAEKLSTIDNLIIGGGSIDKQLERQLNNLPCAVWSTYGMTETLSHIAMRRVNGYNASDYYTPLPGVNLSLSQDSTLIIDAPSLCAEKLITNDIAELMPDGSFRIIGRRDNTVNSGGIKIQIEEVERLLRCDGSFRITSIPDDTLGETLVILVTSDTDKQQIDILREKSNTLPRYWRPRYIARVNKLPLTGTGKPDRKTAKTMALNTKTETF